MGKLELDESGVCRLLINDSCVVSLEQSLDGQGFYLYATVGSIPLGQEKKFGMMALTGNLFGKETGKSSLGFAADSRSLVLFRYFDADTTDTHTFTQKLETFMQYLTYWMNKIEETAISGLQEVSLEKHIYDLQAHQKMKIFFA